VQTNTNRSHSSQSNALVQSANRKLKLKSKTGNVCICIITVEHNIAAHSTSDNSYPPYSHHWTSIILSFNPSPKWPILCPVGR